MRDELFWLVPFFCVKKCEVKADRIRQQECKSCLYWNGSSPLLHTSSSHDGNVVDIQDLKSCASNSVQVRLLLRPLSPPVSAIAGLAI